LSKNYLLPVSRSLPLARQFYALFHTLTAAFDSADWSMGWLVMPAAH